MSTENIMTAMGQINLGYQQDGTTSTTQRANPIIQGATTSNQSSTSKMNAQLASFNCFLRLPKELQLKIWGFGTTDSRVVQLSCSNNKVDQLENIEVSRLKIESPPPAILHASLDSREVALKAYTKWHISNVEAERTAQNTVYINPRVDSVIIKLDRNSAVSFDYRFIQQMFRFVEPPFAKVRLASQESFPWKGDDAQYCAAYMAAKVWCPQMYVVVKSRVAVGEMTFVAPHNEDRSFAVEELHMIGVRALTHSWMATDWGSWSHCWIWSCR